MSNSIYVFQLFVVFTSLILSHVVGNISTAKKYPPTKVVVTGAGDPIHPFSNLSEYILTFLFVGSSVGYHVFSKLMKRKSQFYPIAIVRDIAGMRALLKLGASQEQVRIADITQKEQLLGIFDNCQKVVMCTSARPKKFLTRRIKDFFKRIVRMEVTSKGSDMYYPKGQDPYNVDFIGQKNVIDLAVDAKVEHMVMLGNMGGYAGSKLNELGRKKGETDPKVGNMLNWKRASERYLMKRSFFTIVHAGALSDDPGGQREIVWDVDDSLLRTSFRKIPQEDCAEVLIQALIHKESIGRSIDVASRPPGSGTVPTKDWLRFW